MSTPTDHAIVAPSSLPVICRCPGSLTMQVMVNSPESEKAREGTAAHWVAEQLLEGYTDPELCTVGADDLIGRIAPNGVTVDREMFEAADFYVTDILQVANQHGVLQQLRVEQRTDRIPEIHDECWGTPDCWTWIDSELTLYLWDFKYGHLGVTAFENEQLIAYAIDALRQVTGGNPLGDSPIKVVMRIVQPRAFNDGLGPVREWVVNAVDLRPHVNQINQCVEQAMQVDAPCVPGGHCRYCDAAGSCAALKSTAAAVDTMPIHVVDPADDDLGYHIDVAKRLYDVIKAHLEALQATAEVRLAAGQPIPGWGMKPGKGRRQWKDKATIITTGQLLGVDLSSSDPVGVAEAERRLKAGKVDASVIDGLFYSPPTAPKLTRVDDSEARRLFKK